MGHGPYWYGYEHRGGRVYSKYFGARPTSTFEEAPRVIPPVDHRWAFYGRMDYRTALRIMAFSERPSKTELTARYRSLIMEHHPDHGGDVRIAAAIIMAYKYLS